MLSTYIHLIRDETAASAVEYGLLVFFIALAAFFALHSVGRSVDATFDGVRNVLRHH